MFNISIPKYVGSLKITSDFAIYCTKKPNWFNRKMMELVFGWKWIDV